MAIKQECCLIVEIHLVLRCVQVYDRMHEKQDHLGSRNLKGSAGYCLQTVAISSAHLACVYVVHVSACVCGAFSI